MRQIIVGGAVAGVATSVIINGLELVLKALGLVPATTFDYVSVLVLPPGLATPGYVGLVGVVLTQFMSSAFFGVLFAYVMDRAGTNFWALKGLGYGAFVFLLHVSVIPKLWEPRLLGYLLGPGMMAQEVVVHVSWGILSAFFLTRLLGRVGRRVTPT